jgi:hypothetical protein
MRAITINWNGKSDETFTDFADEFNAMDDVAKIDVIQDSIKTLEAMKDEAIIRLSKKHIKENAQ